MDSDKKAHRVHRAGVIHLPQLPKVVICLKDCNFAGIKFRQSHLNIHSLNSVCLMRNIILSEHHTDFANRSEGVKVSRHVNSSINTEKAVQRF